jgi:hypothetical protein
VLSSTLAFMHATLGTFSASSAFTQCLQKKQGALINEAEK